MMNPIHEKLVYDSIAESRSYSFNGLRPYGAADLLTMDGYVDEYYCGNVPEEIIRCGGTFDADRGLLWMPGKAGYARFVKEG